MKNYLEIITDDGAYSLTKNKEIAEAEDFCSGIVLKCDYLDKRDSTIWAWEKHFIGFDLGKAQLIFRNAKTENTRIKLIRGACIHGVGWDYGKLLITYLLNGKYTELVCDLIYRGEGQQLFLKNPKSIEECAQYFPNYKAELKNNDGYNHILRHSYCFTYGSNMDLISYMPIDSIDIVRIDPYPENSYDLDAYFYNSHSHIGKLPLQIDILGKTISFYVCVGRGIARFDSIFEMLQTIVQWRQFGEEYSIKVSELNYLDDLHAELYIESDTFTFIDLEEELEFEVTMNSKHYDSGYDEMKSYADDAYEGYSPNFLGLDID